MNARHVLTSGAILAAGAWLLIGSISRNDAGTLPIGPANEPGGRVAREILQPVSIAAPEKPAELQLSSTFTPITGKVLRVPASTREGTGGAITSVGANVVLLSHDGDIYVVRPSLQIVKSRIAPPDNGFQAYVNDSRRSPYDGFTHNFDHFRYNDIEFVRTERHSGFIVSYTKYHSQKSCYTTAISFLRIDRDLQSLEEWTATSGQWKDIFETAPCLPLKKEFRAIEGHLAGGRIAFDGKDTLYLASGDYAWDGIYGPRSLQQGGAPLAQDPATDYGKVIQIDLNSLQARRLSLGQRNMQGIATDRNGTVWTVEHGMRGGDELNRISGGSNFGWPYESYGTLYSGLANPLARSNGRHQNFDRPVFAWLPSIAVSGMTRVEGFHETWDGDFLVATLAAAKLVRLRIEDGRVVFAEDIPVGRRIRDVHQHTTGEIVLWTDSRELIFLRPSTGGFEKGVVEHILNENMKLTKDQRDKLTAAFDRCTECHSLRPGENANAPTLAHIIGSKVGSADFANYSRAIRQYEGVWTKERLVNYVSAPQKLIPGTTMPEPNIGDRDIVDGIVEILEHLPRMIETLPQRK
jgi:cytochrome c2